MSHGSSFLNILKIPPHSSTYRKFHGRLLFATQTLSSKKSTIVVFVFFIPNSAHSLARPHHRLPTAVRSSAWRASSVLSVASASTVKPVSLQVLVGQALLAFFPRSTGQGRYRTEFSTSLSRRCSALYCHTSTRLPFVHFDFLPSQIYFNIKLGSLIQCLHFSLKP
jgi:hypothetical protein